MTLKSYLAILLLAPFTVLAQRQITPTESFIIRGQIAKEKTVTLTQLDGFSKSDIRDIVIYNHKGEPKDTLRNLKGVMLKSVFEGLKFNYEKPKELNEFYFTLTASDGYKVVFSWNEIYNTEAGNQLYFITEMNGKKAKDLEQRILFLAAADLKSGRRYIKGLEKIEVRRITD